MRISRKFCSLSWRLPTLPLRVPSAQEGLTAVFGMRTGVTPPTNHQDKKQNSMQRTGVSRINRCCDFARPRLAPSCSGLAALRSLAPHPIAKPPTHNFQTTLPARTYRPVRAGVVDNEEQTISKNLESVHATPTIPFESSVGRLVRLGSTHYCAST